MRFSSEVGNGDGVLYVKAFRRCVKFFNNRVGEMYGFWLMKFEELIFKASNSIFSTMKTEVQFVNIK